MTASTIPVARPFSTGRVGAGTDAAGEVSGLVPLTSRGDALVALASPACTATCRLCGDPAVPGDDLALCRLHGGLGPEWADFDEAAWLAGREAC